jgi:hypothetical protein
VSATYSSSAPAAAAADEVRRKRETVAEDPGQHVQVLGGGDAAEQDDALVSCDRAFESPGVRQ